MPSSSPYHRAEPCPLRHPGLRQPALQPREGRRDPLDSIRIAGKRNTWQVDSTRIRPEMDSDPTFEKKTEKNGSRPFLIMTIKLNSLLTISF